MWTEAHRARHEVALKKMVSACAVEEMARWLERADPPHSEKATPVLPVVGAIAWHLRVGGPWRALLGGFPAWRTVYGWFRRWLDLGLFDRLLCDVARLRRRAAGRRPRVVQRCRLAVTESALQHLKGEVRRLIARGILEPAIV